MSRTTLQWHTGANGARAVPGALLRWREVKRGPWQYGYYRGAEPGMLTFSHTPDGPIVLWTANVNLDLQMAVVVPESHGLGTGADRG